MTKVIAISVGSEHGLALTDKGTVLSWGNGPEVPVDLRGVIAIAAGSYVSLALLNNGKVVGWGTTEVPDGLTDIVAISAGGLYCTATQCDGTVVCWGKSFFHEPVKTLEWVGSENGVAISKGGGFGLSIESGGQVALQELGGVLNGSVPKPLANLQYGIRSVSAGFAHVLALSDTGAVRTWAEDSQLASASLDVPYIRSTAIAVAAGGAFSATLLSDGSVQCWGHNEYGQIEPPRGLSNVVMVGAGTHFAAALTAEGRVVAWGRNNKGQTDLPSEIASLGYDSEEERSAAPLVLNNELKPRLLIVEGSPNEETETKLSRLPNEDSLLSTAREMSRLVKYEGYQYEGRRAAGCSLNNSAARQIVLGQPGVALDRLAEADRLLSEIPRDADDNRHFFEVVEWVPIARAAIFYNYCLALVMIGNAGQVPQLIGSIEQLLDCVTKTPLYSPEGISAERIEVVRAALRKLEY